MLNKKLIWLTLVSSSLFGQVITDNFEDENLSSWIKNADWEIDEDKSSMVLSLKKENPSVPFNLCYRSDIVFIDGNISVLFRANYGKIDQGGGLMWRVQDDKNYYVARFNPLENNFRYYIVQDGHRREIASVDVALTGGWHTMTITQSKDRFIGYLDEKKLLEAGDSRLKKSGGVGVWTKADAQTSFDDFMVTIEEK
jgi:hypothetical protein